MGCLNKSCLISVLIQSQIGFGILKYNKSSKKCKTHSETLKNVNSVVLVMVSVASVTGNHQLLLKINVNVNCCVCKQPKTKLIQEKKTD